MAKKLGVFSLVRYTRRPVSVKMTISGQHLNRGLFSYIEPPTTLTRTSKGYPSYEASFFICSKMASFISGRRCVGGWEGCTGSSIQSKEDGHLLRDIYTRRVRGIMNTEETHSRLEALLPIDVQDKAVKIC